MPGDPLIYGLFPRASFMGATVVDFSISAGWQEQSTLVNITLVEDPTAGDDFIAKDGELNYENGSLLGQPFQFSYGGFTYGGILKSVDRDNNFSGNPLYKVVLTTPTEVLDACQVILSSYIGSNSDINFCGINQSNASFSVGNLLNVFGYAEGGGSDYGRSQITSIGMPWNGAFGIKNCLEILTNTPPGGPSTTNFGSWINYKGNFYKLDLSALPVPPTFYYIGGVVNMSLMELISKFFEDAGCNYIVKMTVSAKGPHTIGFIAVPRFVQQPLGKIFQYLTEATNVAGSSHGQELRSDITQALLVGGSLNILEPIYNSNGFNLQIRPFWGFDTNGYPILGQKPDGTYYADDDHAMSLNASAIADVMGELGYYNLMYPTNILELRCALGNYDTWVAYLNVYKPNLAQQLQLFCGIDSSNAANAETIVDLLSDDDGLVSQLADMFENNHWPAVAQRIYEWIREQAETYYGKKFIVQIPFNEQIKIDPTTGEVSFSNELSDAGFVPEGSAPLGLSYINENFFLDQTGRFFPFVRFSFYNQFNSVEKQKQVTPNIAYLNSTAVVTQYAQNAQNAYLYSRCEQGVAAPVLQAGVIGGGGGIFFMSNGIGVSMPCTVIGVSDAIWAQADDITGSTGDLASMLAMDVNVLRQLISFRSTSFTAVIHPPALYPDSVALAIKSNQYLYGPWGKFAANGKLEVEQDEGLVPWEYGGYDLMTQAAVAKLSTIAMGNQVLERGSWEEAGLPKVSLGEALVQDGPLVTYLQCDISISKVSTKYEMQTFVNRVGAFSQENAERLKRIGKLYQQLRRTMRQQIIEQFNQSQVYLKQYQGFMQGTSYAVEQHTPHAVLGGNLYLNQAGNYVPFSWTQTYQESLANLQRNSPTGFMSTACAGLETLLRPFTMDVNNDNLPYYVTPQANSSAQTYSLIDSSGLNPFISGCDINWLLSGNTYQGMKVAKGSVDFSTVRALAFRGPLVMTGWGYDLQGNPVPNSGSANINSESGLIPNFTAPLQNCGSQFIPGYLQSSVDWPVGAVDLSWDKFRSVWASRGMVLSGWASGDIPPAGTGYMALLFKGVRTTEYLQVVNYYDTEPSRITDGSKLQACYNPMMNRWEPVSASC